MLAMDEVEEVTFLHLEYVGPGRLFLIAPVDLTGNAPEGTLAARWQTLEDHRAESPMVERAVVTLSAPGGTPLLPSR